MTGSSAIPRGEKIQAENCFVCGRHNPRGLNVPFYFENEKIEARYIPDENLCGFDDVVHGGILFALADEAMMHLIWRSGLRAITAEITMRFHGHAKAGEAVSLEASFVERAGRLIKAKCMLIDDQGGRIATANGKFIPFSKGEETVFRKKY